jgi:cytidylate kinase
MIIAIDGPSGAGKSTIGKILAKRLGLVYLDTGAMYRAVGLAVLRAKIDPADTETIINLVKNLSIEFKGLGDELRIFLDGEDVSEQIRDERVSKMASIVSTIPEVRRILVDRQRQIGTQSGNGCVLDGRDIGTVVFPDADFKFFLTAKPEARARRRYEENLKKGIQTSYEDTLAEIQDRDLRDTSRLDSPLQIPENAFVIDTSEMDLEEVLSQLLDIISQRRKAAN